MLTCEKINETIERDEWCHFIIRDIYISEDIVNLSNHQLISEIVNSKYHYWQGEEKPEGLSVSMASLGQKKIIENLKFYGFFDNSKIIATDYKEIFFSDFKSILFSNIQQNCDSKTFLEKVGNHIPKTLNENATYYRLDLNEKSNSDIVAEWHVYSFFYAFLAIDRNRNIISLIEFGQD